MPLGPSNSTMESEANSQVDNSFDGGSVRDGMRAFSEEGVPTKIQDRDRMPPAETRTMTDRAVKANGWIRRARRNRFPPLADGVLELDLPFIRLRR